MVRQLPFMLVVSTMVLAIVLSHSKNPKRAIKVLYYTMALIMFLWAMACITYYPREVFPD
jgi:hypothetical protein